MNIFTNAKLKNGSKLILDNMLDSFPGSPEIGEFAFVNGVLYIYSKIGSSSESWYPLTNFAENYVHQQIVASTTWEIQHNLNSQNIAYFVYDDLNQFVLSEVEFVDDNNIKLHFTEDLSGRCVIFASTNAFSQGQTTIIYIDKYAEKLVDHGTVGGTVLVSLNDGVVHKINTSNNITFVFEGWATGNRSSAITVSLQKNSTHTVTFPENVIWADGTAPTFASDTLNRLVFVSDDGGVTIQAFIAGLNIR